MPRTRESASPISREFLERWSPRSFSDQPVETQKLQRLFEAARFAPSSYNEQPWAFFVATKDNPAEYERMLSCLVEKNQAWAKRAPVLLISVARLRFEATQKPNRHAAHDVGIATGFLMLEATNLGLFTHAMAGIVPDKVREVFGLPENTDPIAGIALGYLGDPAALPDDLRKVEEKPTPRKPIGNFVYSGKWGTIATIAAS